MKNLFLKQDRQVWITLGQKVLAKMWDNPKDEAVWKKYI